MKKVGYARVSTEDQNLDLQLQALHEAGCLTIHKDKASGTDRSRRGLQRAIRACGEGDVLVAWKLDRLGRSLIDLVRLAEQLSERGIGLKILTGLGASIDTTKPEGRMFFAFFAALAEFEGELIRERTIAGMAAARQRGVHIGRPRKLSRQQLAEARTLMQSGQHTVAGLSSFYGIDASTLRRYPGRTSRAERFGRKPDHRTPRARLQAIARCSPGAERQSQDIGFPTPTHRSQAGARVEAAHPALPIAGPNHPAILNAHSGRPRPPVNGPPAPFARQAGLPC